MDHTPFFNESLVIYKNFDRSTEILDSDDKVILAQEFCRKPSGMTEWQPLPQDGATGGRAGRRGQSTRREAKATMLGFPLRFGRQEGHGSLTQRLYPTTRTTLRKGKRSKTHST